MLRSEHDSPRESRRLKKIENGVRSITMPLALFLFFFPHSVRVPAESPIGPVGACLPRGREEAAETTTSGRASPAIGAHLRSQSCLLRLRGDADKKKKMRRVSFFVVVVVSLLPPRIDSVRELQRSAGSRRSVFCAV